MDRLKLIKARNNRRLRSMGQKPDISKEDATEVVQRIYAGDRRAVIARELGISERKVDRIWTSHRVHSGMGRGDTDLTLVQRRMVEGMP